MKKIPRLIKNATLTSPRQTRNRRVIIALRSQVARRATGVTPGLEVFGETGAIFGEGSQVLG